MTIFRQVLNRHARDVADRMATIEPDMRLLLEWVFENALDEDKSGFIEERRPTASPSIAGMAARTAT